MTALFRNEVLQARKNAWLGPVQIAQPLPVRIVAGTCIALLGAVVLFAGLGTYTRRVHATGILMPKTGLITLASPAVGVVTSAAVKEGDQVEKGDLLYVINLDTHSDDGATEQKVIAQLTQQKDNLEKQRNNRIAMSKVEKQSLRDQLANLQSQYNQLEQQIAIQDAAVAAMKTKAEELKRGVKAGYVTDPSYENQNYLYIQSLAEGAQFQQSFLQVKGHMSDTDHQLSMFDAKLAQEVYQIDRDALRIEEQLAESQAKRSIEIRAPEDGIATSIRVHPGQQVGSGTSLVTLLPRVGQLEVNLFVNSAAIGFVEMGAPVVLRYAAYPFQRYGLYRGKVKEVTHAPVANPVERAAATGSADSSDSPDTSGEALYRILVTPNASYVTANGLRKSLEAGMRVDADIALEKRPLYRWLFDPLYHIQRSMTLISDGGAK